MSALVTAVSRSPVHEFSKDSCDRIRLLAGLGVGDDSHAGVTVQHRSRVARDPSQPNLRQVHIIHSELHDHLASLGFDVAPGALGENITTRGIDLLGLPRGTRLHLGPDAVVEVTGLRNPCFQIDDFSPGLLAAVLTKDDSGRVVRTTGIMSVVLAGGDVRPGDQIAIVSPDGPHVGLERV